MTSDMSCIGADHLLLRKAKAALTAGFPFPGLPKKLERQSLTLPLESFEDNVSSSSLKRTRPLKKDGISGLLRTRERIVSMMSLQ